jgi:hypothetical protein
VVELKLTAEQRRLVDEYTEVRARVMAWRPAVNPDAARFGELEAQLLAMAAGIEADQSAILKGNRSTVPVTECERKRTIIKIPSLFRLLGTGWVSENCKPTLKAIQKALTKEQLAKYVSESRSGPRTLGEPVTSAPTERTAAA